MGKIFNFTITVDVHLTADDIWPDGDAPENPTVADVLKVIEKSGGKRRIIRDWDLDADLELSISDEKSSEIAP